MPPTSLIELSEAQQTRIRCVLRVTQTVVSFRSVPRILQLFNQQTAPMFNWIPHFTSVINWTLRLGLGLLKQVKPIASPWLALVDYSIDVGTKKALVVLRVKLDVLSQRNQALQVSDCECIGLQVSETVNGDSIELELEKIFAQAGTPVGIIKEGEPTLNKGVRQWSQAYAPEVETIEDLSHVMANALKKHYESCEAYQSFIALINGTAKKLRQTSLAFLIPPKLRTKGRFLSISRLGRWGKKVLELLLNQPDSEDENRQKLQATLPELAQIRPFIEDFAKTTDGVCQVMKLLKNHGLEQNTYEQCQQLLELLPDDTQVKHCLTTWLDRHILIQKRISSYPLPISSDVIESLFGRFKHLLERSPQADMNRSVLLIPTLCGTLNEMIIRPALSHACHADLKDWEEDNIPYTMRKKRQDFFQNRSQKSVKTCVGNSS